MFDLKKILRDGPLLLDGATGTCLQRAGMPTGVCPELWILEHREVMQKITRDYMAAGSRIVYAPTFSGNRLKLSDYGAQDRVREINETLVRWTREAVGRDAYGDEAPCYVAGDMTMTGQSLAPAGDLEFEELVDCYKEQVRAIDAAGVDLFVIETMMNLGETRAAVLAVKEETNLPVFVTMTFEKNGRTLYGTDVVTALVTLQAMGVDAFGINCSCGPDLMLPWLREMKKYAKVPLIVKPNAGLPKFVDGQTVYDMAREPFADAVTALVDAGAAIVGGCCGTSPDYIRLLSEKLEERYRENWAAMYEQIFTPPQDAYARVLTSERKFVRLAKDEPFMIIGERINPTGKKDLQAELLHGATDMILDMAETQTEQGAQILDINVGMGGIDEKAAMLQVIEEVSETVHTPLCIDSADPSVIGAALRRYQGRALVNSVSCEKEKMEKLLPMVKKYGAMFILLPMAGAGLPENAQERRANIDAVIDAAEAYGISREDVVVDGLTCTIGACPTAGADTLDTIAYATESGLVSVCGLSNISFGLPDRGYVNSLFLALAISRGLTMAIANPAQPALMRAACAAELLMGRAGADIRYIDACARYPLSAPRAGALSGAGVDREGAGSAPKTAISSDAVGRGAGVDRAQGETAQKVAAPAGAGADGEGAGSAPKTVTPLDAMPADADAGEGDSTSSGQSQAVEPLGAELEMIYEDVLKGRAKAVDGHIEAALSAGIPADQILNRALVPAINVTGDYFAQQKYFLPQLMISAEAMRRGVAVLEPELMKNNQGRPQGPTVVIATVKGDVHDIGKNLVAMMMKNYGFNVIDLGKDVDKETIIQAAKSHRAQVIALSALMTTTMQYMRDIIDEVHAQGLDVKVIVGGAALTAEYAAKIGADGYSEDAVGAVRLVSRLLKVDR